MPRFPLQYIDLFSGCGGLSTGLHLAGWKGLFAVERNPAAFATLKANLVDGRKHFDWPSWLPVGPWDIKTLLKEKSRPLAKLKGTVDLVVGGPPCQGFSTAGRRVEGDERNHLVHSYLDFVKLVQPRAILFENVRGTPPKGIANFVWLPHLNHHPTPQGMVGWVAGETFGNPALSFQS